MFRYRNNKFLGPKHTFNWLTERNVTFRSPIPDQASKLKDVGEEGFDGFSFVNFKMVRL